MKKLVLVMALMLAVAACKDKEVSMETNESYVEKRPQIVVKAGEGETYPGPSTTFTGNVHVQRIYNMAGITRNTGAYVTFEAGARSNWHDHPAGQTLVVTDGVAWTQEWNGTAHEAHAGDVIYCPQDVKHWHGASPDGPMTHISIVETVNGSNVNWMEAVTDEQYEAAGKQIRGE